MIFLKKIITKTIYGAKKVNFTEEAEEETNLVIKMNAGKANENIKHSKETLDELDEYLGVKELSFTKSNSYVNI